MTTPRGPQDVMAAIEEIKKSMPGIPRDFVPQRAAGMQIIPVPEALQWMTNVVNAVNNSSRLPITAVCVTEADGSLTIRVTPTPSGSS